MTAADASIRKALPSQGDLKARREHCSVDGRLLGPVGAARGQQIRIRRTATEYALYTVSERREEDAADVARLGLTGPRARRHTRRRVRWRRPLQHRQPAHAPPRGWHPDRAEPAGPTGPRDGHRRRHRHRLRATAPPASAARAGDHRRPHRLGPQRCPRGARSGQAGVALTGVGPRVTGARRGRSCPSGAGTAPSHVKDLATQFFRVGSTLLALGVDFHDGSWW
jgi:hypothetical protein